MSNAQNPAALDPDGNAPVTGHVYDGIQEYDNPLPGWWTTLFYLSILFSGGYLFINLARPEWVNTRLEYENDKAADTLRQFAAIGNLTPDYATLDGFLNDPEKAKWLTVGEGIFNTNCVSCHGKGGTGVSGPNLTDDSYLLIKKLDDIPTLLVKGSVAAGMPAWGNRLSTNEIVLVASYVASLRGQNLPGKETQGEVIPAWTESAGQ
ncbi:Cbb3-type cytochrome c oxidase subunit CcoP2 [Planctomycetes bacterium Poly30]|uniref:Cbb3-type cytochrome c oxidase subunit CcoP2 n=1 Tax=Saltatorellus ferox TaxID=2528018 RepID=A0A518F125_9BACT|nr:Cbb3-type cytochrome c oxidase subunit CcoP2 [Planctomycetes bacterium Poly30]